MTPARITTDELGALRRIWTTTAEWLQLAARVCRRFGLGLRGRV